MASNRARTTLLDLPAPCFEHLLAELDPQSRVAAFRVCRATRDMTLSQWQLTVAINLPTNPDTAADAQAKLLLALKHSPNVKLKLAGAQRPVDEATASASDLLLGAVAARGQALAAITCVELSSVELDAVVPPWLTTTCTNMTKLTIWDGRIGDLLAPATPIPACPQLRELHLSCVRVRGGEPMLSEWQHQMRALTGLTSLRVSGGHIPPPFMLQSCSVIGPQLRRLQAMYVEPRQLPALASWFPGLREFVAKELTVDDQGMEALLSMQGLRKVVCYRFGSLQGDYTQRPCRWAEVGCAELDIAAFARLPLEGVRFADESRRRTVHACQDLVATTRVVELLCRDRNQVAGSHVTLQNTAYADTACLVAALPILSTWKVVDLTVSGANPVTPELLNAIGQHLHTPTLKRINLLDSTYSPELWPLLLPCLSWPSLQELYLSGMMRATRGAVDGLGEAQVTEMCVHACRPVEVEVCCDTGGWEAGWEGRVRAAMAAAGHQHVTLKIDEPVEETEVLGEEDEEEDEEEGEGSGEEEGDYATESDSDIE